MVEKAKQARTFLPNMPIQSSQKLARKARAYPIYLNCKYHIRLGGLARDKNALACLASLLVTKKKVPKIGIRGNKELSGASRIKHRLEFLSKMYHKASNVSGCKRCIPKSDFSIRVSAKRLKVEMGQAVSCSQCHFSTCRPDDLANHYLVSML